MIYFQWGARISSCCAAR